MTKFYFYMASTVFVYTLFCISIIASAEEQNISKITSSEKKITSIGVYVMVEGRWKKAGGTSETAIIKPPVINTVDIICDKTSMKCEECVAQLTTAQEMGIPQTWEINPHLSIDKTTYEITEWANDTITGKASFYASDYFLKISTKDNIVERRRQETKERGNTYADPNVFEIWVLE